MKKEFVEDLRDEIREALSEEDGVIDIDIQEVVKNNNTVLTGLVFKTDSNIAPVIYVDHAYEQFEDGKPLDEIVDNIINT